MSCQHMLTNGPKVQELKLACQAMARWSRRKLKQDGSYIELDSQIIHSDLDASGDRVSFPNTIKNNIDGRLQDRACIRTPLITPPRVTPAPMSWRAKALATRRGNLNSIPVTHIVKGKKWPL